MYWEITKKCPLPILHKHPRRRRKKGYVVPSLNLVTRKEWGAVPNTDEDPLKHPLNFIRPIQTHTDPCNSREECIKFVNELQKTNMYNGMPDIQYNFLIAPDGTIFEGRGWFIDATRPNDQFENEMFTEECVDIAFIGKFDLAGDNIPDAMIKSQDLIIEHGLERKYIHCCFRHLQFLNYEY